MSNGFQKEPRFKTRWHHRKPAYWFRKDRERPEGVRDAPECLRLEVEPGTTAKDLPPVRIYLGTEPAQYRAERVFVWSVMEQRDPARVYEIYLMKDIRGFDRQGWKTGFTNYRYAIPTFAGGQGRAIYNDVDQIYLSDPAELFDMDMKGAGMLGITERETSVMLIDCEKMINPWQMADAQAGKKHKYFREITHGQGLWGQLPGEWNARDDEFRAGQSKCFHFTTLQTQPWRPFPDQLRYQPHPDGEVWHSLERGADAAGFTVFTKESPSHRFRELLDLYKRMHNEGEQQLGMAPEETFNGHSLRKHIDEVARLASESGAQTILDYGAGKGLFYEPYSGEPEGGRIKSNPKWPGVRVTCYDPGYQPFAAPFEGQFDGVITTDVLEHIPDDDIPWVLDEIFAASKTFVYAVAALYPARKTLPNGENAHCTLESADWWCGQMAAASRRQGGRRWVLCTEEQSRLGKRRLLHDSGSWEAKAA